MVSITKVNLPGHKKAMLVASKNLREVLRSRLLNNSQQQQQQQQQPQQQPQQHPQPPHPQQSLPNHRSLPPPIPPPSLKQPQLQVIPQTSSSRATEKHRRVNKVF